MQRVSPQERSLHLMTYGGIQRRLGRIDRAIAAYEEAVRTIEEDSFTQRRQKAYAHAFLCEAFGDELQDAARAEPHCAASLAIFGRIDDPRAAQEIAQIEVVHALYLAKVGQIDRARQTWQSAYERELRAYGEDHRRVRWARSVAAQIEEIAGDLPAAMRWIEQAAAEPFLEQWGDGSREGIQIVQARLLAAHGRIEDAAVVLQAARERATARSPVDPSLVSVLDFELGRAWCSIGRKAEGRTLLLAALAYQSGYPQLQKAIAATRAALAQCPAGDGD